MNEFKFACPVCGQHITAAAGTSGAQIECPTCFQKIIVPQERSGETKLILNAAMADRPRPVTRPVEQEGVPRGRDSSAWLGYTAIALVVVAAAAGIYALRGRLLGTTGNLRAATNVSPASIPDKVQPASALPTNMFWTLEADKAPTFSGPVAGILRGETFTFTRATLQGGTFSVRQGKGWPPALAIAIMFPAKSGEELAGKHVTVAASQAPPVPKVVMRWTNAQSNSVTKTFASGYMLDLKFGKLENAKIPGSIYIAFPDDQKSFLVGEFVAEVRPPEPKKKKGAPKSP